MKALCFEDEADLDIFIRFFEENTSLDEADGFYDIRVDNIVTKIFQNSFEFINAVSFAYPFSYLVKADVPFQKTTILARIPTIRDMKEEPTIEIPSTPVQKIDSKILSHSNSVSKAPSIANDKQLIGMTIIAENPPISGESSFVSNAQQLLVKEQNKKTGAELIKKIRAKFEHRYLRVNTRKCLQKWSLFTSFKNENQVRNLRYLVKKRKEKLQRAFYNRLYENWIQSKKKFAEGFNVDYIQKTDSPKNIRLHHKSIVSPAEIDSEMIKETNQFEKYFFYKILSEFSSYVAQRRFNIYTLLSLKSLTQNGHESMPKITSPESVFNVLIILDNNLQETVTLQKILTSFFHIDLTSGKLEKSYTVNFGLKLHINLNFQILGDVESLFRKQAYVFDLIIPIFINSEWTFSHSKTISDFTETYIKPYVLNQLNTTDQNSNIKLNDLVVKQIIRMQLTSLIPVEITRTQVRLGSNSSSVPQETFTFDSISVEVLTSLFNRFTIKVLQSKQKIIDQCIKDIFTDFDLETDVPLLGYETRTLMDELARQALILASDVLDKKISVKASVRIPSTDHWHMFRILFIKNLFVGVESIIESYDRVMSSKGSLYFDHLGQAAKPNILHQNLAAQISRKVENQIKNALLTHPHLFKEAFSGIQSPSSPLQAYEQNLKLFIPSFLAKTSLTTQYSTSVYIFPLISSFIGVIDIGAVMETSEKEMNDYVARYRKAAAPRQVMMQIRPQIQDNLEVISLSKRKESNHKNGTSQEDHSEPSGTKRAKSSLLWMENTTRRD